MVKKIFVFLSILSIVFIPVFSSKANILELDGSHAYYRAKYGDITEVYMSDFTPIVLDVVAINIKTFVDFKNYMISNNYSALTMFLPSATSLDVSNGVDRVDISNNMNFAITFVLDNEIGFYFYFTYINLTHSNFNIIQDLSNNWVMPLDYFFGIVGSLYNLYDDYFTGYNNGYDTGYYAGFTNGTNYGYDNGLNEGYYLGYDEGYDLGYDNGFNAGVITEDATGFGALLGAIFSGLSSLLSIELLPGIYIGAIFAVPLVFGIIYFILGKRKD